MADVVWDDDALDRCANCGTHHSQTAHIIGIGDGEWACSPHCNDQHDEQGCPFEHGLQYREGPYRG